jgi:hypothetical protein
MKMKHVCIALSLLLLVGCTMPSYKSLNAQRAAIRSAGDVSVTLSLDTIGTAEQVADVSKKTKEICVAIESILGDGKISSMPIADVTANLRAKIPADYQFLYDMLISQVDNLSVPTAVLGGQNVKRMLALCDGIITGCDKYVFTDRSLVQVKSLSKDPVSLASFGATVEAEFARQKTK